MKKISIIIIALLMSASAFSQSYKHAVGIKLGAEEGFVYKQNLNKDNFFEVGLGWFVGNSLLVNGFYLWNFNIPEVDGLAWYVGPGAYIGGSMNNKYSGLNMSVNARIGIEYKFVEIPLALSLDWSPGFEFIANDSNFYPGFGWKGLGLGVKYAF